MRPVERWRIGKFCTANQNDQPQIRSLDQSQFECLSPCAVDILSGDRNESLIPGLGLCQREFAVVAIR
jgi:hypothetical protein